MSVTQIPPRDLPPPSSPPSEQRDLFEAEHWETAYRRFNPDDVPHLLIQLQDDLSRSRKREALWLSVVLHLLIVILLWNSDKLVLLWPWHHTVVVTLPNLSNDKDTTYLALPPDEQKLTRRPETKVLSDKDRVATSKNPQLNRDELKKILDASRAGRPGPPAPAQQPSQQPPAAAQNQAPPQQSPQQAPPGSGLVQPSPNNQQAQLQAPPQGGRRPVPNFNIPQTAGSAIEQAAQAAAANRGHYGGGEAGDYGLNQRNGAKVLDQMEVLTDTMGVDFGPYLARVVQEVKANWYRLIPDSAMPPIMKKGKLAIEFVILKDGKVSAMKLDATSGDNALDRAAWGGITASNPFAPLPKEFPGQYIGLRFFFYYNPDKADLQ